MRLAAQTYEQKDAKAVMTYPADFAMKTVEQLENDYKLAVDSGLGYEVQWQIKCQILQKMHRNSPEMVEEIKSFEKYRPFKDKTEQAALNITQGRDVSDPQRILFENWPEVQEVIKTKLKGGESKFYQLSPEAQRNEIKAAIDVMTGAIIYPGAIDVADDIKKAMGAAASDE
jgi:hypothetical protein